MTRSEMLEVKTIWQNSTSGVQLFALPRIVVIMKKLCSLGSGCAARLTNYSLMQSDGRAKTSFVTVEQPTLSLIIVVRFNKFARQSTVVRSDKIVHFMIAEPQAKTPKKLNHFLQKSEQLSRHPKRNVRWLRRHDPHLHGWWRSLIALFCIANITWEPEWSPENLQKGALHLPRRGLTFGKFTLRYGIVDLALLCL